MEDDLFLNPYGRGYLVTGNTLDHKVTLKGLGGKWNPSLKGWIFAPAQYADVLDYVESNNSPVQKIARVIESSQTITRSPTQRVTRSPTQTITRSPTQRVTRSPSSLSSPSQRVARSPAPTIERVARTTIDRTPRSRSPSRMQTLTYQVQLPILNQEVTVRMHNKDKIYTVYEIVAPDDIRLLHDDVIDRAVVVNGQWKLDNMIAHEIIF